MPRKVIAKNKRILESLTGIYKTAHVFNLKKNTCRELYAFNIVHEFFLKLYGKMDIQNLIHTVVRSTTSKDYLVSLLEFTDFSTLQERIEGKNVLSFDFIGSIHGWTRSSFIPVSYDRNGKLKEVIYTTRIIQSDKDKEEELLAQSLDIDSLTGVYNRRALERDCLQIVDNGMSDYFTIVTFDINDLMLINDKYGYKGGDELIKGAASCISSVFSEYGKIYRTGGDEFTAFIDCDIKTLMDIFGSFDSTTAKWKGVLVEEGLTISKGCAAHPEFPELKLRELHRRAERRMFQEKEQFHLSRKADKSDFVRTPGNIVQVIKHSNMGLVSIEYNESCEPGLLIDDFIRDFMGLSDEMTEEQLYAEWYQRIHPDYVESVNAAVEKAIIGSQVEVQYPWYHPKAGIIYIRTSFFIDSTYSKGIRLNGFFQSITNLIQFQKDSLTGLYTKEFFFQKADEILAKNPDKNYRIFVSDIENFKAINEKYGIEASDKLLQYLAKSLRYMAPNLVLAGRINADKFVCLQYSTARQSREDGLKIQQEILSKAPIPNVVWKHGIYYTEYGRNISAQTMCDRAREAVESIKGNYEVSCALYNTDLANKIKIQQQILGNMEESLKNREFEVYLQPKYDLHVNRTGGAEALIRWIHPEIGFMNPGDFIPVFEKNGFVKNIDQFVFYEVCAILRRWLDEGKPVVPISVNLSRRDFEYEDLASMIIKKVDKEELPHSLIHFELTESAFSDNPKHIANTIRKLHDSGFVIELDDFGAGYSSLTSLSEIEFDVLKLDMSIIRNDNPSSSRNVLDMCSHIMKQMNFKSVAEGVENEKQLQRLKDLGCDYIQGYYFSKPLPIVDFEEYLRKEV